MGFRTGSFATVWSVEQGKGNFSKVRLSTSRKDKNSGEYVTDFSGFCTFIGTANAAAAKLRPRDRIKLGDVEVTNTFDKATQKGYTNFNVFSFDRQDTHPASPQHSVPDSNPQDGTPLEGDKLPF